jgi:hypothetical protein
VSGPFESEQQVLDLPAVRAIYDAMRASTRRGVMAEHGFAMLAGACEAAGVDLGGPASYDRAILAWLAGFGPQYCAVIAGLISRAAGSPGPGAHGSPGPDHG